jgi:hypothetical protein
MDEPWIIYLEEFRDRAETLPEQEPVDEEELAEALQETNEAAVDRFQHQLDLRLQESRRMSRAFGKVAEAWIRDGGVDWDELEERLELVHSAWDPELGASPA